jgi:hypothetical protein
VVLLPLAVFLPLRCWTEQCYIQRLCTAWTPGTGCRAASETSVQKRMPHVPFAYYYILGALFHSAGK